MKMFPKTQDHTVDRLLRAQGGRRPDASPFCSEFDADLANAYVERRLPAGETSRYEAHLAACSPCRKSIVALTRMAQAETPRPDTPVVHTATVSPVKRWLGALATPQWALAAAAAIVLAITLPLVLSHRRAPDTTQVASDEVASAPPAVNAAAGGTEQKRAPEDSRPATENVASASAKTTARENSSEPDASAADKPVALAQAKKDAPAATPAPVNEQNGVASAASQPAAPTLADKMVAKNQTQTPPATPPAAAEAPASSGEKETRQAADSRDAVKPAATQPGRADDTERAKAESEAQNAAIAPPPAPPHLRRGASPKSNRGSRVAGPAISAFSSGSSNEVTRVPERKVADHLFFLRGGIWTDKDYDSGKDMAVVTIIRDSDVYLNLLAKDEKLKQLLTGFPAEARVIFVFKDTVYKLIPQDGDK
jgi:Putative zinc-finger